MFCPKCGTQNPETGKFCRACGTDLGNVSAALTGVPAEGFEKIPQFKSWKNKKGKPISYETAVTKMFTGLAFLLVAIFLAVTKVPGAQFWWFWLLIPAFGALGSGIAQYIQLKKTEQQNTRNTLDYGSPNTKSLSPEEAPNAIQNLLDAGNKIEAIKIHREVYGTSLKEAKEAVERIEREQIPLSYYNAPSQGSIYDTGELTTPPSVTEGTTRHLEINKDGETMTLPKK